MGIGSFLDPARLLLPGRCGSTAWAVERREAISLQLPDTLDQMSIAVQAGLGFDAAMIRVARNGKGELAGELIRAMQDIQVGQPRRDAYVDLAERCGVPELRRFMRSIVQAETYGLALSDVLHTQADEMRMQATPARRGQGDADPGQGDLPADPLHPAGAVHRPASARPSSASPRRFANL